MVEFFGGVFFADLPAARTKSRGVIHRCTTCIRLTYLLLFSSILLCFVYTRFITFCVVCHFVNGVKYQTLKCGTIEDWQVTIEFVAPKNIHIVLEQARSKIIVIPVLLAKPSICFGISCLKYLCINLVFVSAKPEISTSNTYIDCRVLIFITPYTHVSFGDL